MKNDRKEVKMDKEKLEFLKSENGKEEAYKLMEEMLKNETAMPPVSMELPFWDGKDPKKNPYKKRDN